MKGKNLDFISNYIFSSYLKFYFTIQKMKRKIISLIFINRMKKKIVDTLKSNKKECVIWCICLYIIIKILYLQDRKRNLKRKKKSFVSTDLGSLWITKRVIFNWQLKSTSSPDFLLSLFSSSLTLYLQFFFFLLSLFSIFLGIRWILGKS